jgi:tRNA G10  N-methylase Trm11
LWELESVLGVHHSKFNSVGTHHVQFELDLDPHSLMRQLGGVVKIGKVIQTASSDQLPQVIFKNLSRSDRRIKLALSATHLSQKELELLGKEVKSTATKNKQPVGYRILKNVTESSGIGTRFEEFMMINPDPDIMIVHTIAAQDIDRFRIKDYGRPKIDRKSGMLPPKIARIMINIATSGKVGLTIYDPMCGSGTILAEALDMGLQALGSDINQNAVQSTQENLQAITKKLGITIPFRVWQQDISQGLTADIVKHVDAVVFEGYLGPPDLPDEKITDMTKGLVKLYTGVFKQLSYIIPTGGVVVAALPAFASSWSVKMFDKLVDSCEKYGYTQEHQPVEYGRPQAKVKRRIYKLKKSV